MYQEKAKHSQKFNGTSASTLIFMPDMPYFDNELDFDDSYKVLQYHFKLTHLRAFEYF